MAGSKYKHKYCWCVTYGSRSFIELKTDVEYKL